MTEEELRQIKNEALYGHMRSADWAREVIVRLCDEIERLKKKSLETIELTREFNQERKKDLEVMKEAYDLLQTACEALHFYANPVNYPGAVLNDRGQRAKIGLGE